MRNGALLLHRETLGQTMLNAYGAYPLLAKTQDVSNILDVVTYLRLSLLSAVRIRIQPAFVI